MNRLIYTAAHLGYDTTRVPVGGGAQVAWQLIRRWAGELPAGLTVLGSGPVFPSLDGVEYVSLPWRVPSGKRIVSSLSVREYASFSRQFERGVVGYLERLAQEEPPRGAVVLHNDIAEAGDFQRIRELGYRQAAIFHVDVVDYVANIYLRRRVSAAALARLWRGLEGLRVSRLVPDIARLMFAKQEACARYCDLLIVPSSGMKEVLLSSYPWLRGEEVLVVPWGTVWEELAGVEKEKEKEAIERQYGLGSEPVLLTLSRISPEKGQDLLLAALRIWERREGGKLTVFICGAAAFMHGEGYLKRLRRRARKLRKVRVFFPGYVAGSRKAAFFELADLYVFPSRHESYGLTMLEAMAAGLPVLTTPHRSARDLVRPDFGLVVPASPQGIYRGLRELLSRRAELPVMGRAAREFASSRSFDSAARVLSRALGAL